MMGAPRMRVFTPISFLLFTCAASPGTDAEEPPDAAVLVVAPGSALSLEPMARGERTEAALDGGLLAPASALTAPASGDHWLAVVSRDAVGNVSPVRWVRLRVDAEPPEASLEITPSPVRDERGRPWVPGGTRAEARAADSLAGLARLSLETGGREVTGDGTVPLALPLGDDGACVARAVDRVGNRSQEIRLAVNVDTRPPSGRIRVVGAQVEAPTSLIVGPEAKLELDREDGESGVAGWTGSVDGRETSPEAWSGPWPAGRHEAAAEVVDRVGNRSSVAPLLFEVDAAPPEIAWQVENEGVRDADGTDVFRPPVFVRVQAEDPVAGVAELARSEVEEEWDAVGDRFTTTADTVRIRARDRVGNEAATTARWRLDADPPRIFVDGEELDPAAPRVTLERPAGHEFRIAARDDGAGVQSVTLSFDGETWGTAPEVLRFLDPGQHRLGVTAVDRLGNARRLEWEVRIRKAPR
jgi:hypothetical protein